MDKKITEITVEQIEDSRKKPTLKVSVGVANKIGSFSVPSGASTGAHEAMELRDETGAMSKAINEILNTIKPTLLGIEVDQQETIDKLMIDKDGTEGKSRLGGNSMIGVSIASAKTAALVKGIETYEYLRTLKEISATHKNPWLYFNLINGGKHASTLLGFQEYHIVPQEDSMSANVEISRKVQAKLDEVITEKYGSLPIRGDEGGLALSTPDVFEPLELLKKSVDDLGCTGKVMFALDVAASSLYDKDKDSYIFANTKHSRDDMMAIYMRMAKEYPILSIEDPFHEEDFEGFRTLQKMLPDVKIIGDDLTVTNILRLKQAIDEKCISGIIIKPNQIGTLSETLATMKLATENGIACIVSHRSGETMDDFIADLAYAFGCFGIKAGALGPKERNAKYDRLIKISK